MKDKDKKLDFDLGFLDKESPKLERPTKKGQPEARVDSTSPLKRNWKIISIIVSVILVIIWMGFSDGGSNDTTIPNEEDTVIIGEYRCSRHHYDQAVALDPYETEQQIESARSALEYRADALERLQDEIEGSYVNEYSSQWEIDQYNEMVDEYNSKPSIYNRDAAGFESRVERYNTQVEQHNNYLIENCTKR